MFYFAVSAHCLTTSDDHYVASRVVCWDRRSGAVIVGLRSAGASAYSRHPSHQLLHPHVQRRCQGDESARARIHRGAGAGLALFELLVGVGGDAGNVDQGFLARVLGDAGALQPQTQAVRARSSSSSGVAIRATSWRSKRKASMTASRRAGASSWIVWRKRSVTARS